jgi:hypothetical protein
MRIPKKINICGRMFDVRTDTTHDGGSVDTDTRVIEIGTNDPEETPENLIHEVGEAIMIMRDFRYAREKHDLENEDYRFFMNHGDWQLFCKDLAIALKGIKFDK